MRPLLLVLALVASGGAWTVSSRSSAAARFADAAADALRREALVEVSLTFDDAADPVARVVGRPVTIKRKPCLQLTYKRRAACDVAPSCATFSAQERSCGPPSEKRSSGAQ